MTLETRPLYLGVRWAGGLGLPGVGFIILTQRAGLHLIRSYIWPLRHHRGNFVEWKSIAHNGLAHRWLGLYKVLSTDRLPGLCLSICPTHSRVRGVRPVQTSQKPDNGARFHLQARHSAAGKVPTVLGMMRCWGVSFHTTSGGREAGERWDGTETFPSSSHPADCLNHGVCIVLSDRCNDSKHLYLCK